MKRHTLLLAGALIGLSACDGFREAMTAHVDTAANAGGQELSVTRLATLLGESSVPLNEEIAGTVTQMWVDFQLLALAAAENDSLSDPAIVDSAMWAALANIRAMKHLQTVSQSWGTNDTTPPTAEEYAQGDILAASHILLAFPGGPQAGTPPAPVRDSVRAVAESVLARVTPQNFADLAREFSTDPSTAPRGGELGMFPRGVMVPEFERALVGLQPGEISPLVQSQFGFHIIERTPFAEIDQAQFAQGATQRRQQVAESTYFAGLEASAGLDIRADAAETVREVAADLDGHRDDRTVVATMENGNFTAARLARWISVSPPQQQLQQNIASAPDSVLPQVVRRFAQYDLLLRAADSANVTVDSTELDEVRRAFSAAITGAWSGIGISPAALSDSAQTPAERRTLAAARVESYLDDLLAQRAQFVDMPAAVEDALRDKYDYRINDTGIERALQVAGRVRAQADSAREAQRPPTAVPMPGSGPADSAPPASQP